MLTNEPPHLMFFIRSSSGFFVTGPDALGLLHRLTTQDCNSLSVGQSRHAIFTTHQGKMLDWVQICHVSPQNIFIATSPQRAESLMQHIERYCITENIQCALAPEHVRMVFTTLEPINVPSFADASPSFGMPQAHYVAIEHVRQAQALLSGMHEGSEHEYERYRMQQGIPSSVYEYAQPCNPLELRLTASSISFSKGCYLGQEVIARLDAYNKVQRMLMGFETVLEPVGQLESVRLQYQGQLAGKITSWAPPLGNISFGLAMLKLDFCHPQLTLDIVDVSSHTLLGQVTLRHDAFFDAQSMRQPQA